MKWIAIKHPITYAFAIDGHATLTPMFPPTAPAPCWPYLMPHHNPFPELIFGKWTDASSVAQNLGICLWQHDWGLAQPHVTVPANPNMALILLGSTLKLQLPSSSQKLKATGGAIAAGEDVCPAAAFPVGFILCQSCWDISGKGFVLPTGFHFSPVCNVFLDVKLGDIFAAVFAMASDALTNLAASSFGARFGGNVTSIALANIMGAFGRTKGLFAYLGFPTLGLWDAFRARSGQRAIPKGAVKNWRTSGTGLGLLVGAIVFDVLADAVQGTGPTVGEAAPSGTSPTPR